MKPLELERKLLDNAIRVLQSEMRELARSNSESTFVSLESEGKISVSEDWYIPIKRPVGLRSGTDDLHAGLSWPKVRKGILKGQSALQVDAGLDANVRAHVREEQRLLLTVDWLDEIMSKRSPTIPEPDPLSILAEQAKLLHEVSETWTIYKVAWQQRHEKEPQDREAESLTLRSIRVADQWPAASMMSFGRRSWPSQWSSSC